MDNELLKKKELEGEYSEQQKAKELQNMQNPLLPPGERIEAFDKEMKTPVALSDEAKQEAAKRGLGRAFGQSMYDVDKQYKEDPSSVGDYINKLSEARQSDVQYARMKTFKDFLADGQTQQYIKSPEIQNLIKAASASESPEERDHIASRVYWLLQGKYSQSDYAKNANEFEKRSGGSLQDTALKYQLDNFNADVLNQIDSGGEVSEKSNRNLRAANHFINESKRLINNAESGSGILKGAGDAIFDPNTWTLGISDLSRTLKIKDIADKYDRGEKLTVDENALMDALALNLAANSFYSSKLPKQYKWGQIAGESLPFMVEFILNPVASAGSGLAKTIAKRAISKFAATGARKTAIKAGARIIGDAIGAAGMTLTTGAPGTVADAINRNLGQGSYDYDEDGKIVYTGHEGGDNAVTSALKAAGANFLEYQSEMVGASGIGSLVGKSIPKGWVKSIKASEFGKSVGALKKSKLYQESKALMRRGQWSGTVGEYGEEVYNQFMNALLIGDNKMSDLTDIDRQVDTFMGLALTGGVMGTINTAAYIKDRSRTAGKLNEADRKSSEYFQEWDVIKSQLKDFSVDERSQSIKDVLKRTDIPNEAKKSFADYISALTYRDSLIGADSQIKKENKDLAEQNGREMIINPRLKKVLSTVNQEKMELESRLGDIASIPEDQVEAFIESGMITPEQLDDLNTYNQRLAEYEGVVQQLREEIDMQMGPVQEDIQRVARRDGSVIYADFSGEGRLPIINGNVSQKPDGSIDIQNTDKSLTVLMPDGRKRIISSKFITGNVQINTPEELIEEARQQAYQSIVTPIEEEMTGTKKFKEGDQVEYVDEKGQVQAGSVASLQGNTVTVIPNDGNKSKIKTFTQEQLRASLVAETLGNVRERDEFHVNIPQGFKNIKPGNYKVDVEEDIQDGSAILRFTAPGETDQYIINATLDDINSLIARQPQADATQGAVNEEVQQEPEQVTAQEEPTAEIATSAEPTGKPIAFLDQIPKGDKGSILFEQAPAETTIGALNEVYEDANELEEAVNATIESVQKQITKTKSPKPTGDINKDIANKQASKQQLLELNTRLEYWNNIKAKITPAKSGFQDRIESISTGKIKDRESNMGEYLSLRDYLLRNIASGRYKFAWNDINGTRGLKNEVFASRNTESERKKRISFLDNTGYTPETLAHEIWENAGQGNDIREEWTQDINDIRDEIIDIMLSHDTPTSMVDEAAALRQNPETVQEYEESIDPALIFEYEANEASQDEMLRSLPTLELYNTISDAEVDAYFSQQTSEEEFNNYINSITFEQNNIQNGTDSNTGAGIGDNQSNVGQDPGTKATADDAGGDRGSVSGDQDQQASDITAAGEAAVAGERSAQEGAEQPITEGTEQESGRPAERQDVGIEPIAIIEAARRAVESNRNKNIDNFATNENQNEQASETRLDNRPAVEGGTIGTVVGGQPQTVGINRTIQASNSAGSVRTDYTAEELEELDRINYKSFPNETTNQKDNGEELSENEIDKSDNKNVSINATNEKLSEKENIEQQSVEQKEKNVEPIDIVKIARDAVRKDKELKEASEKLEDFGEKIGGARKDMGITRKVRDTDSLPAWRRKYSYANADGKIPIGTKVDTNSPFTAVYVHKSGNRESLRAVTDVFVRNWKPKVFNSEQEAEDYIPIFEADMQGFRVSKKSEEEYVVGKKSSTGKPIELSSFPTREEAETYLRSTEGATSLLNRKREDFSIPALEKVERTGKDYRDGRNISTDEFMKTFGFRGGEFGNWVKSEERQTMVNMAYDSFMDMADILGVSPRTISLNGELGIAFGARGTSAFAAHFEPLRTVINLTRMNGAGSLAHEWAHALDNYFGLQAQGKTYEKNDEGEVKAGRIYKSEVDSFYSQKGMRLELREIFDSIVKLTQKKKAQQDVAIEKLQGDHDRILKSVEREANNTVKKFEDGVKRYQYNRKKKDYETVVIKGTPEQVKKVRDIVDKISSGNGATPEWNYIPGTKNKISYVSPELMEIENLHKDVFRKSGIEKDSGGFYNLGYYATKLYEAKGRLDKAKEGGNSGVEIETEYMKNSKLFDSSRAKPYWSTKVEMFARAFEYYIQSNLDDKGIRSDYLQYDKAPVFMAIYDMTPYPMGEERTELNKLFKDFFETVQEKVDEETGNVALFEKQDKYETSDKNLSVSEKRSKIAKNKRNEKGKHTAIQTQINWEEEVGDLPARRDEAIDSDPSTGDVQRAANYEPAIDDRVTNMERALSNQGHLVFAGDPLTGPARIQGANDVAFLFKNLENAQSENVFFVFANDEGDYKVLYHSTGSSYSSIVDLKMVTPAAKEFGATKIWMVHNHLTGNLNPSSQDTSIHHRLMKLGRTLDVAVMPSIIINLDSGQYTEFGDNYPMKIDMPDKSISGDAIPVNVYSFDRQALYVPSSEKTKITSSMDVAEFLSKQKRGSVNKIHALILDRSNQINRYSLVDGNISTEDLVKKLLHDVGKHGESVILSSNGVDLDTNAIKEALEGVSSSLLDVLEIKQDEDIINNYRSFADEMLLEEQEGYKTGNSKTLPDTISVDGIERPATNSEGNPIAQTEEGIRNFWKWFGESKVVDEDGRPLVVYHGTDAEFNEFIPSKRGIWLTPNKERAKGYAQNRTNNSGSEIIMPLYANIKNPLDQETNENYVPYNKLGHDGWISKFPDGRMFTVVVENSNQIKSVENVGSFDPGSDDIRLRTSQKEIKGINGILNVSDLRAVQNRFDNPANETEKYNAAIDMVSIIETMFNSDARTIVVRDKKGMANVLRNYGISEERALYYENYDGRVQGMFFRGVVIINSTDNTDSMDLLDTWVHETRHDYNSKNPEEVLSLLGNIPDELYSEVLPDEYIKLDETDKLDELLSFLTEKAINNEQLPDYNIVREQIQPLINNYLNKITDGRYQNYQNVHRERRVTETSYGDIERGTRQADRIAGQGTDTGKPGTNDGAGRYSRERNGEIVSKLFDNADNLKSVIPNYPKFLGDVFNGPGKESILAEAKNIGVDKLGKAIENYLSQVDTPEELQRIKGLLGVEMPDNALRYLLWRNVNPDDGSVVWKAKDAVKRDEMRGDVLFRMGDEPTVSQLQQYEQITKSKWFAFEQEHFNDMLSLRTIQEIITGKKDHEITGRNNPYKIFKLYRSRAHQALQMYTKHIYGPMIESLGKANEVLEKTGMRSIKSDLQGNKSQYLHATIYAMAKSGLSRMKWMARRDADSYKQIEMNKISVLALDDVDYEKALNKIEKNTEKLYNEYLVRDVSGLTALANLVGREDENFLDVANSIVAESERILGEETVNDLWDQIRESNHWVLQKEYESGKMTKEQYEWYLNTDEFYLPHRGYDVTTAGDKYSYLERTEGDFNSLFKHAKGRTSLAENPFAHIASMAASGILEAEKNRAKRSIYRMVVMNPNDIVTVRDVWTQNMGTGEIPDWREVFPETKDTDTPDQVRDKITAFEDKMNSLAAEGMAKLKINQLNLGVPIGKGNASEHAIRVWVGGQEKVLYVNGNPVLAQAVNGLFDRKRNDEMQKFINSVKNVNRFMSGAYTSYNPEFGVTNGLKDAHAALAFSYVEHGFGFSARLFKNLLSGSKAVANYTWTGRFSGNQYGRYMEEFMKSGGPTGFTFIKNIDSYSKDMQKLYKKSVGSVDYRMVPKIVAKAIENFNQMIELNTRFATYVTARESGFDITDSSYNAKNITINFEQHGAAQGFVARYLRDYVIFSNAALQGIYRIIEAGRRNPKRMAEIVASTFASGALMPLITNLMLSMFGDDDDKEKFANISPWIKLNNLTVYIGNGKFLTYPLSHEYRWIYGIANIGSEAIMGNLRGENIPLLMAEQLTSVVPIDAFSGLAGFVPSATKPIFELWGNKNFTGRSIYKENQWTELDPEWTKAFKNTWTPYVSTSKSINKLSGGDDVKKGWVDRLKIEDIPVNNPDVWQHLTRSYLGGGVEVVGNMVNLTQDIVDKAIADADNNGEVEDINLSDIPFVRRIMRESTDRDSDAASSRQMGAIYDFVKDYEHLERGYRKLITEEEYRKKYSNIIGGDDRRKYESLKRMMNNIDKYKSIPGREDDIRETRKKMIELFWEEN
ncbi:MAG: JAB domain-containing protein [Oscillospiraceae bacterium]|nr:JAB domain-containing protein [Oscillospiraceae bacterium]